MASPEKSLEKRQRALELRMQGHSINSVMEQLGMKTPTWYHWYNTHEDFRSQADKITSEISQGNVKKKARVEVPDFPEFCEKYLNRVLFTHQLQWFDILEGREPRDLHPSQTYVKARPNRLVVNTPPEHGKSDTITTFWVLWNIMKNPDIQIAIVSKSQGFSKDFIAKLKDYLTNPAYKDLQNDFAPVNGWKGAGSWTSTAFTINGRGPDAGRSPTVIAMGIGGQIYGYRFDIIIIDDAMDSENVNFFKKLAAWVRTMVSTRVSSKGRVLIIGTRIAAEDLYSEIMNPRAYSSGESPWSMLIQPAVKEYAENPEDWVTLWPYSNMPLEGDDEDSRLPNGLFAKWDGRALADRRAELNDDEWARIYMQQQVSSDSVFNLEKIQACMDGRSPGIIPANKLTGREEGMAGLTIIAGLDPATVGFTAIVVYAVDTKTGDRYILDAFNESAILPDALRALIYSITEKFGVQVWRVERNAFQRFLTQDTQIKEYMSSHGVVWAEHTTGNNKNDPDFGVMAMESLFDLQKIHLPQPKNEGIRALINQLVIWEPQASKHQKTDVVMALWFCEIWAGSLITRSNKSSNYVKGTGRYTTRNQMARRINTIRSSDLVLTGEYNG